MNHLTTLPLVLSLARFNDVRLEETLVTKYSVFHQPCREVIKPQVARVIILNYTHIIYLIIMCINFIPKIHISCL